MPCKGDKSQICGAGQRLSLYKTVGWSPPINPVINGYDYFGCYSEVTSIRALSDGATQSNDMTVEKCATFCKGAAFFGLEFGTECCTSITRLTHRFNTLTRHRLWFQDQRKKHAPARRRLLAPLSRQHENPLRRLPAPKHIQEQNPPNLDIRNPYPNTHS